MLFVPIGEEPPQTNLRRRQEDNHKSQGALLPRDANKHLSEVPANAKTRCPFCDGFGHWTQTHILMASTSLMHTDWLKHGLGVQEELGEHRQTMAWVRAREQACDRVWLRVMLWVRVHVCVCVSAKATAGACAAAAFCADVPLQASVHLQELMRAHLKYIITCGSWQLPPEAHTHTHTQTLLSLASKA